MHAATELPHLSQPFRLALERRRRGRPHHSDRAPRLDPAFGRAQQGGLRRQGRCHLLGDRAPVRPIGLPQPTSQSPRHPRPPSRWCGTPVSKPSQRPSMDRQWGMGCRVRPPAHLPARVPARRLPWSPPPSLHCRSGSGPWPLATARLSPVPFAPPSRCQRPPHRWPGSSTRRGTGSGLRSFWPRLLGGDGSSLELGPAMGLGFFFAASREIEPPATAGPEQPHGLQEPTAPEQRALKRQATAAAGEPPCPP